MTIAVSPPGRLRPRAVARPPRRVNHRARLFWLLGGLVGCFLLLVLHLTNLQVVNPDRYREHGLSQRTFSQSLAAERGVIYDRNGVELAMSKPASSVFVDPELVDDPAQAASAVAPLLGLGVSEVEAKMRGPGRFSYLARKVDDLTAQQVRDLGLAGVGLLDESARHHPSGGLARSVLGTVDVDNTGLSGVERMFGEVLSGTPGRVLFERNPSGRTIPVGEHQLEPAVRGDALVLSLDRAVQFDTERILAEQIARFGARGGIAIVSRPDTGEILAMANMVNDREAEEVLPSTNNAAVTTVYEPGSVMKAVTIAAALEAGAVGPDTVLDVPATIEIDDAEFADEHPLDGAGDVREILASSSNVGTIKTARLLGKERLYHAIRAFGFGERTAIDFPDEQGGVVPAPKDWWGTSIGTIPIGQGISVTPLQMLMAYNVIANDGVYVGPTLVRATIDPDGGEHPVPFEEPRRVLSSQTADTMNLMLREVVSEGTGRSAAVDGYTPAGKTGTSWKPQPEGGYEDAGGQRQYQATFVGFVPAEQPALSIIVVIDEPDRSSGTVTGGAVAAPAFSKIASLALRHLGIAPPLTDGPAGGVPVRSGRVEVARPTPAGWTSNGTLRDVPTAHPLRPPVAADPVSVAGSSAPTAPSATITGR